MYTLKGFPTTMDEMKFPEDKVLIIHALGFPEPIEGKVIDYNTVGPDIVISIDTGEDFPVHILVKNITGWQIKSDKSKVAA